MNMWTLLLITLFVSLVLAGSGIFLLVRYMRRNVADKLPFPHDALTFPEPLRESLGVAVSETHTLKVVVVTDYNESAGFGWLLYNALNCFHLCEARIGPKARPVVYFTKGYYDEKRPKFVDVHKTEVDHVWDHENWFNNFFMPVEPHGWRPFLKTNFQRNVQAISASANMTAGVAQFDRNSLNGLSGQSRQYTALWQKYLHPRPHILRQFEDHKYQLFPKGATVYAVHYRGSDKFPHSPVRNFAGKVIRFSREDDPVHPPYEWVFDKLREAVAEGVQKGRHGKDVGQWILYCASDEQPFVDAARESFGVDFVTSKPATIRSDVSTSGLDINTSRCGVGIAGTVECDKLQELVEASVHRGHMTESNYKKGEDVLLETMLISVASVFYRSRGNFSNLPIYMKLNSEQIVIDMASLWKCDAGEWIKTHGRDTLSGVIKSEKLDVT